MVINLKYFFLLSFLFINCIYSKIYYTTPNSKTSVTKANNELTKNQVIIENAENIKFYPILLTSIFYSSKYENIFGSIDKIILDELNKNNDLYNMNSNKIIVKQFTIENRDNCSHSLSKALVEIKVLDSKDKEILSFKNNDMIKSYVGDCSNLLYIPTIFGMFWYVPHMAVNGTRQDQVNYLGNNALKLFFENLKNLNIKE